MYCVKSFVNYFVNFFHYNIYTVNDYIDTEISTCYNIGMDIKQAIKIQMVKSGVKSDSELASRCGWSKANYSNKLQRANFKLSDLETIAEALGCNLVIEFVEKERSKL